MKAERDLFDVLEDILKKAKEPLTCVQLFDYPEVKRFASTANRVSDYLGGLWRKGKLVRSAAPITRNSAARWQYAWKPQKAAPPVAIEEFVAATDNKTLIKKANVEVTERGGFVIIDLPQMNISIRIKA